MTRSTRILLTSAVALAAATGLAVTVKAQQQFGPPQQSLYAHNPGTAPTYVSYNEYIPSVPAATKPAASTTGAATTTAHHVAKPTATHTPVARKAGGGTSGR